MLGLACRFGGVAITVMMTALPAPAMADLTLTVLGLSAPDGADDAAERVTAAVRAAAARAEGVTYVARDVALDQIVLAFDCVDPPDAPCLRQVGAQMETDAVAYGYVREHRDGSGRLDVTLVLFDVRTGEETRRVDDHTVQGAGGGALDAAARALVARLLGREDDGAEGPSAAAGPVEGASRSTDGTDDADDGGRGPSWVAWGLFGAGVALAGVGTYFTLATASRNGGSGDWHDLRAKYPGSSDVCGEPNLTSREESLCDGYTLQSTLQFAFYGVGAAAGAIGLYLLLRDPVEETDDPNATATASSLRAAPVWVPGGGGVVVQGALP